MTPVALNSWEIAKGYSTCNSQEDSLAMLTQNCPVAVFKFSYCLWSFIFLNCQYIFFIFFVFKSFRFIFYFYLCACMYMHMRILAHLNACMSVCMCVCACACMYVPHGCRFLQKPEEGIRHPGARVTGNCELCDIKVGNQTRVFW